MTVIAETIVEDGRIILRWTVPDGTVLVVEMTADECRQFCNSLGAAILHVSRTTEVMT
jgi:hypothetical protein